MTPEAREMDKVAIYTDGACSGNPGPGGWAAVLMSGGRSKEISGGERSTTNNRMELMAVISALGLLKRPCIVTVYTDSQYIEKAVNQGWLESWKKKGWRRREGELKNAELWMDLDGLLTKHSVVFKWVKGHADNHYNNRCDELAVMRRDEFAR